MVIILLTFPTLGLVFNLKSEKKITEKIICLICQLVSNQNKTNGYFESVFADDQVASARV